MRFALRPADPQCYLTLLFALLLLRPCWAWQDNSANNKARKQAADKQAVDKQGRAVYSAKCAKCHGRDGQGVKGKTVEPLGGESAIEELAALITETMPEDDPETCMGEEAKSVARFLFHAFYSNEAKERNRPTIKLARLTGPQLRQSLADLYGRLAGQVDASSERGLSGEYFDGQRPNRNKRKIDRLDSTIDFDFAEDGPGDGINAKDFCIQWVGGLHPDKTGRYEILIESSCAFVLNLGSYQREFINNYVQSGDRVEFRRSIVLTAGRVYPLSIRFHQRKRKTQQPPARIKLSWTPPGGLPHVIPARNLRPNRSPAAFSIQAKLPPDDRSYGYARGIGASRQWDESTTAAAIEFAEVAAKELWPAYARQHRNDANENRARLRAFLSVLVETAFRSPLNQSIRKSYIDEQVDGAEDDEEAIKRVLLMTLKSPRFLYPTLALNRSGSQQAANQLALTLFDSLPSDPWLLAMARENRLETEAEIRNAAKRMIGDYRARSKTRELMRSWLDLDRFGEITKDPKRFPGFDSRLTADLERSLDIFVDSVVWSESSDFRDLFLSKSVFTNDRIGKFYGDSWAPRDGSKQFGPAKAKDMKHSGLLTHPYILSGLAYQDSTSPIHRGVFLIRHMLGRTLRPPQEAFVPLNPDLHPHLTTRQRVSLQTSPKTCQACHIKINGLGFTLEHYDAVGRFRNSENNSAINAKGGYTTRANKAVDFDGVSELAEFLANSDDARHAFVHRAFQHLVKQPPAAFGSKTMARLTESFRESGYSIRELLIEIAVVSAARQNESTN